MISEIRSTRYGSKGSMWAGGILKREIHERIQEVEDSQEEIFR